MLKRSGVAVVACAMALSSWSQQASVGTIQSVNGLVTVNDGTVISNVTANANIVNGATFVTTASSGVTLLLKNGTCAVTLQPNQALTIDDSKDCAAIRTAVKVLSDTQVAALAVGGTDITAVAGILVGLAFVGSQALSSQ